MTRNDLPPFISELARQLRRRRLSLGIYDYDALRQALLAGFGLSSRDELCRLCVALWAKSPEEIEIIRAVFNRGTIVDWNTAELSRAGIEIAEDGPRQADDGPVLPDHHADQGPLQAGPVRDLAGSPPPTGVTDRRLVMAAQYPLSDREIAQAWRRLRRPLRTGPAVELDVAATVQQYSRLGIPTEPVLVPRRRNTAKLLLLIDRFGSMTPFHGYVDHIVNAISSAGRIDDIRAAYFHDLPGAATDRELLAQAEDPFSPDLDSILPLVQPMTNGWVYDDPKLTTGNSLPTTLEAAGRGTATVIVSDAGAARQRFDKIRLLDTVAFLKALRVNAACIAWLNPIKRDDWARNTSGQVARYVPMYPLSRDGLNRAVDTLRGRPANVERPL